jgi:hypothetical protein
MSRSSKRKWFVTEPRLVEFSSIWHNFLWDFFPPLAFELYGKSRSNVIVLLPHRLKAVLNLFYPSEKYHICPLILFRSSDKKFHQYRVYFYLPKQVVLMLAKILGSKKACQLTNITMIAIVNDVHLKKMLIYKVKGNMRAEVILYFYLTLFLFPWLMSLETELL